MTEDEAVSRALALAEESFITASGPGGQNVNKVATAVQLRVDATAIGLQPQVYARLKRLAGTRMTNAGEIVFRELELSWNGCGEKYPSGTPFGCWGQTAGGYGDGLGTGATAGHWIIEDSTIHHNTSDGLDLLYMKEGGRVTIRRTWAEGNAGNQLKTKGDSLIENSVVVGNCAYFVGYGNMHDGDHCRALGNALSIGLHATSTATLVNNTITSQGDCLVLSGGGGVGSKLEFVNNLLIGEVDWRQPWDRSCGHYSDGGSETVSWTGNYVTGVKNGACPAGSLCTAGLLLIANSLAGTFDPTPVADDLKPTFDSLDTNKDGQLAKEELPVEHELATLFASFDDDADTYLSRPEFDDYAQGGEDEEEP